MLILYGMTPESMLNTELNYTNSIIDTQVTVELQWLEHIWNHENVRDMGSAS